MAFRKIADVRRAPPQHWVGDGFPVRSMFSYDGDAKALSPFLLLDYAAPAVFEPAEVPRGVGEHPHRGFETVTIAYQGEIEHRDSGGNAGRIGAGDVQWMTAASGVVHEEFHGRAFTKKGGTLEMVQLWVNLPARFKMSKPAYQDLLSKQIPVVEIPGGSLRVIAGDFQGSKGPARTFTPVDLWDLRLKAGASLEAALPEGHTAALLNLHGAATLGTSTSLGEHELAVFERRGGAIRIEAAKDSTLLLLSGEPIDEPVVGYGPFVMNTQAEIRQAITDYQAGRMGALSASRR